MRYQVYAQNRNVRSRANNDSAVYEALKKLGAPSTIGQIARGVPGVSEKTVRRALKSLQDNGFVIETGKLPGSVAILYATSDSTSTLEGKLIPFAGSFATVEAFMRVMSSPTTDPLKSNLKAEQLTEPLKRMLRVRMLFAIMSAGEAGFNTQLEKIHEELIKLQKELERYASLLGNFNESAIWYEQYRDQIAHGVRKAQQKDAELYQLCWDFIKGGAN